MYKSVKKAIFPAAGLGTRFLPATKVSPKEMLPIVDKPQIQYAVEEAERYGIEEFIIVTGKHKRAIEDHFDSFYELEETLESKGHKLLLDEVRALTRFPFAYIRQRAPLGLGHAILCTKPFVREEPFAVLLSDDIIDPEDNLLGEMISLFNKYQSPIVALETVPHKYVQNYGIVKGKLIEDNLVKIDGLVEKPEPAQAPSNMAIIGRYILTADIFEFLEMMGPGKGGEIQLTDAIQAQLKKRALYGYLFKGRRYDAGYKLGYLKATIAFALKNPQIKDHFREYLLSFLPKLQQTESPSSNHATPTEE
jgi:UTP--glucose-1-phosphate uridylyltransferase